MANAIAGTGTVTVDGVSIRLVGELSYKLSSNKREVLVGMDGVHGFKDTPDAGYMKFTGRNASDTSTSTLNSASASTIVFDLVNGKTVVGSQMWRNGDPIETKGDDATFEVEFAGPSVTEQLSATS